MLVLNLDETGLARNPLWFSSAKAAHDLGYGKRSRPNAVGTGPVSSRMTSTRPETELVAAVTKVEQDEMSGWTRLASERPKT